MTLKLNEEIDAAIEALMKIKKKTNKARMLGRFPSKGDVKRFVREFKDKAENIAKKI